MGFAGLTAFNLFMNGKSRGLWGGGVLLFLAALVWSSSKGPIIGTLAVFSLISLGHIKNRRVYVILTAFGSAFLLAMRLFPESPQMDRLLTIGRVFNLSLESTDYGSIGIRLAMWQDALEVFLRNPISGVGVGNWQFNSSFSEFAYPHNMTLEVAAETGIVGLTAYIIVLGVLFFRSSSWMRASIVYFVICTSFSGDFTYFRFVVAIPIGLIAAQKISQHQLSYKVLPINE
jgi:O-antigen ligase